MVTAVDTNVLIDVFQADPRFGKASSEALMRALDEGAAVVCDVVWVELAAFLGSSQQLAELMANLNVAYLPMSREAADLAGDTWRQYKSRGGQRERVAADFLIGAHAMAQCDRLLTRDSGFCRSYFQQLEVIDPAT